MSKLDNLNAVASVFTNSATYYQTIHLIAKFPMRNKKNIFLM